MNLSFFTTDDDLHFSKALVKSPSVRDWLSNKLAGNYGRDDSLCTLNVSVDQRSLEDQELPDFNWSVTSQEIEPTYHYIKVNAEHKTLMVGGLIYRGTREVQDLTSKSDYDTETEHYYTSHT